MNKKILVILLIVLVLVWGLYFFTMEDDKGVVEQNPQEQDNVVDDVEDTIGESANDDITELAIDKLAPNFTLESLQGEEVSLEDYRGKIVLINFWGTWCQYCDKEMPDLQRLHEENDDLMVLAIDVMEEREKVEEYIKKGGYDFKVLLDTKGEVARTYLVSGFPTSYFVDKDGILLGGVSGMMTYAQVNQILESIRGN
ncbi:TlpA family protein disulfide reductase [Tepidimicrobium xylanilyticum]|uniref:Thiol-disulfide isomerase or thioredoxin n=1 Tax=Tepidimicrobium xylanilyticum TaxID=1123352 RepID=A0A1H3AQK0_9FIRM|nr:TlpA disulfide reductase family protein [Tepidimicrobium xylanilyticum]GMG97629.1 hypothetical protein EN5CB1_24550 [Tepidimicrobium xylanilyticum]SDX31923.1 Thiol-disulfide isomerase or thioredoxin [Tepidimicrobium xylanilyticum]